MNNYGYCMSSLVSALTIFVMVSVFSSLATISSLLISIISYFFFGGQAILGVILGMLYVVTDTQNFIYRPKNSQQDVVMDAKLLLIDLVKIFYKLYEYKQK